MIDIDKAIFTRLTADAGVTAIVSTRVYPGESPENVYPLLAFETAEEPSTALNKPDLTAFEVTITAEARSRAQARALYRAAVIALSTSGTWGGVKVRPAHEVMPPACTKFAEGGNVESVIWEVEGTLQVYAFES